ncbi:MAG: hypothetical protein HFJ51_02735 [Clostridia bacterium]|nr:hypothetical protein [Clostridia bacterium]
MKKPILIGSLILILIILVIVVNISSNNMKANEISKFNLGFESYENKTLHGADILTIINKAIDNNKEHKLAKDEKGNYIDDNKFCIRIELILLAIDEDNNIKEVTYPMETLEKAGLDGFISSFSLTDFKYEKIEYNSENRVSKILVKQLEI